MISNSLERKIYKPSLLVSFLSIILLFSVYGYSSSISHNGFSYKIITSPITGKKWLDRNLGATAVCTKSPTDSSYTNANDYVTDQEDCFGDLYQWGRLTDGHEKVDYQDDSQNLETSFDPQNTIVNGKALVTVGSESDKFITGPYNSSDWTDKDDSGRIRTAQWSRNDGQSICPYGFRVPRMWELTAETVANSIQNTDVNGNGNIEVVDNNTAFLNFLKIPATGYRDIMNGDLISSGEVAMLMINTYHSNHSVPYIYISDSSSSTSIYGHVLRGKTVRCIKSTSKFKRIPRKPLDQRVYSNN